ncbi:YkgJ family cysteine cluster protein [Pseudoflavitalea rhizosphaerae]|uniref:YkgJ family cysteine cluster protein n=1 Tax=Pseudoflavitalea rhizosphaerae TaxID=1884793 RepID=UPI000F8EB048|nr:YkgJ family cysteine cluster protein [Pseudoflavitalea rhizosphaerae]
MSYASVYITPELNMALGLKPGFGENEELHRKIVQFIEDYQTRFLSNWNENKGEAILSAFRSLDEVFNKRELRKGKVSCKKGCSFCCNLNVRISKIEAIVIADYCRQNGFSISPHYLESKLAISESDFPLSQVKRCVFLKNNECSIYEVRPFACRRYLVKSNPDYCNLEQGLLEKVIRYVNIDAELFISALLPIFGREEGRLPEMMLPFAQ